MGGEGGYFSGLHLFLLDFGNTPRVGVSCTKNRGIYTYPTSHVHFSSFRVHYTHPWSATSPPMLLVTPELNVPPPFRMTSEEITDLHEKVSKAFNTVEFLQSNGLDDVTPTEADKKEARALFTDSPAAEQDIRTPGKALMLRALLSEYDFEVVRNAAQVRRYIQLKLLEKSDCGDNKTELRALEMLGKMSDVAAFAERVEVNVTHRTTEELENELAKNLPSTWATLLTWSPEI